MSNDFWWGTIAGFGACLTLTAALFLIFTFWYVRHAVANEARTYVPLEDLLPDEEDVVTDIEDYLRTHNESKNT